jgi:hypothetical protein
MASVAPALEKRIREALATPGRPGMRKIAARFGVNPGTGSGSRALSRQAWSAASGEAMRGVAMFQMLLSDGSEGAPLELRGLFKQFLDEVAPRR